MEIKNIQKFLNVESDNKSVISLNKENLEVLIDDLNVSFPGEYEKSGILLEVKKFQEILFYSFTIDNNHLVFVLSDEFELKEDILGFFGDVDVLIIFSGKKSVKIYENIEARIVIPFGEGKDLFLQNVGHATLEELKSYKVKKELPTENTEFINLKD